MHCEWRYYCYIVMIGEGTVYKFSCRKPTCLFLMGATIWVSGHLHLNSHFTCFSTYICALQDVQLYTIQKRYEFCLSICTKGMELASTLACYLGLLLYTAMSDPRLWDDPHPHHPRTGNLVMVSNSLHRESLSVNHSGQIQLKEWVAAIPVICRSDLHSQV